MNIEEVRDYCLSKCGATEDNAFGPDTVLFRLCGKIFACIDLQRPYLVVVKMLPDRAVDLRERFRGITGAWHWNKRHWSDVRLDADVDTALVCQLLDESYLLIRNQLPQRTLYHLKDLPEGWWHQHYAVLDSAMSILHGEQIREVEAPFQLVTVDYQTAGKGQGKNTWESEDKANLLFAFRFFPKTVKAVDQFKLSQCISIAVAQTLEKFCKKGVCVKWPNDVYCEDKKVVGILIEHDLCGAYLSETRCGIGINVNQKQFRSSAPNPASLAQFVGSDLDRSLVLRTFVSRFMSLYHKVLMEDFEELSKMYFSRLYRKKGWFAYRDKNGEFEARIQTVQDNGCLVLVDRQRQVGVYAHKEVEYLLPVK